jgi:hypothetical protein
VSGISTPLYRIAECGQAQELDVGAPRTSLEKTLGLRLPESICRRTAEARRKGRREMTLVRPQFPQQLDNAGLRHALQLAAVFALVKLALQVGLTVYTTHLGYGYFRDEFYYIICGRFLDWGYVDQSPMVALQARLATILFGKSLVGLRLFSAMAGAARVFLTGLIAWSLGGRRAAQFLAMLCVIIAPCYIGGDGYLSMNSFESIFWMGCILTLALIACGASPKWWLMVGLLGGLGLENKPSMTFFLVALVLGLLVTPQRKLMASRWFAGAIALTILLALPNLLWQFRHHWPTWEFLTNGKIEHKSVVVSPVAFILEQILTLHPLNVLVWGTGLVWLLVSPRARNFRWIGATYLFFLAIMIALHAKDYYLVPIYPMLFAAGALAWEGTTTPSPARPWRIGALATALVVTAAIILPMASPILAPEQWIRYTQALHLTSKSQEKYATGPLPQFYADRFGWQEMVDQVTHIYDSLPAADKAKVGIYCSNYGEASAVNFLGHGLPFAVSGHNNYFLWGPHGYSGEVMIVISGDSVESLREYYSDVQIVGEMNHPYSMSFEHRYIFLVRGRKQNLTEIWPDRKHYI